MGDVTVAEQALNILIFLLAGLATVIGMLVLAYTLAIFFDRCVNQRGDNYVLTPDELDERRNAGDLIKRAGLAGILPQERARVIRRFFEQRTMTYSSAASRDVASDGDNDEGIAKMTVEKKRSTTNPIAGGSPDDVESQTTAPASSDQGHQDLELENLCMLEHNEGTCPICLSEYAEGDKIITGTNCSHIFHMECCMQWLEKGNSHCAYCRKNMMKPNEFLLAAREELGNARVDKIVGINEVAARRLAEYEAAVASGADDAEASRQFVSGALAGDTVADPAAAAPPSHEGSVPPSRGEAGSSDTNEDV